MENTYFNKCTAFCQQFKPTILMYFGSKTCVPAAGFYSECSSTEHRTRGVHEVLARRQEHQTVGSSQAWSALSQFLLPHLAPLLGPLHNSCLSPQSASVKSQSHEQNFINAHFCLKFILFLQAEKRVGVEGI